MPTHILQMFSIEELRQAQLRPPFQFTKGVPVLKVPVIPESAFFKRHGPGSLIDSDSLLFNVQQDPKQSTPIRDVDLELFLEKQIAILMKKSDAPEELFNRFSLVY